MKGMHMTTKSLRLALLGASLLMAGAAMALTMTELSSRIAPDSLRALHFQELNNVRELTVEPAGAVVILAVSIDGRALPIVRQQDARGEAASLWDDDKGEHLRLPHPFTGSLTLEVLPRHLQAQSLTLNWTGAAGTESTILR
jgi:hypothetical protein